MYGTSTNLSLTVTDNTYCTEHQISVQNLAAGATYEFYIASVDQAGNRTQADNGGQFYRFVALPTPSVLLVNAFVPDDPLAGTKAVPLNSYTDPLDQSGFTYA